MKEWAVEGGFRGKFKSEVAVSEMGVLSDGQRVVCWVSLVERIGSSGERISGGGQLRIVQIGMLGDSS